MMKNTKQKSKLIYTVTGYEHVRLNASCPHRCFGWKSTLQAAKKAVKENKCDLHECLYDYIVIEAMKEGIFPRCEREWWYKWDRDCDKFLPIEKPESLKSIVNFAIG